MCNWKGSLTLNNLSRIMTATDDGKYQDKLNQYFTLHYELLTFSNHDRCYIGTIFHDTKENCYVVVTHQIGNLLQYVQLEYDSSGNLLPNTPTTGCVHIDDMNDDHGFAYIGTYKDYVVDDKFRRKIYLSTNKALLETSLERLNGELQKTESELKQINEH